MKLNTVSNTIQRGSVGREQEFSIAAKGKAFSILTDGLYTDPKLAIVRELCCNARDSHQSAGKLDVPFMVHLPNKLEPWLEIRDYGIGLSEHDVFFIFCTVFESTKDQSDDFIGCLGLGSKAPFAYSDAFEVVSWFDGVKTTYSMFKNEHQIPSVAKMAESPTDESNGLSVKLTIRPEDHTVFRDKLAYALKYFEVKPEVVGSPGFEFQPLPEDPIRGDGWFVSPSKNSNEKLVAVQGGVGYRIDRHQLSDVLDRDELRFIDGIGLVLYFEMGQIDVPPSREEVRYDDQTKANIAKKIRQARAEFTVKIEERVAHIDDTSTWEGFIKLRQYSSENFPGWGGMGTFVDDTIVTNPLLQSFLQQGGNINIRFGIPACGVRDIEASGYGGLKHYSIRDYTVPGYGATRLTKFTAHTRGNMSVQPTKDSCVVLLGERNRAVMKLSQHVSDKRLRGEIIAIVPNDYKTYADNKEAKKELEWIIEQFGKPPVVNISDVVLDENSATMQKAKASRLSYYYKFAGLERSASAQRYYHRKPDIITWKRLDSKDTDAPTGGLYYLVHSHRHIRVGDDGDSHGIPWISEYQERMGNMLTIINNVKGTSYTNDDVWGAQTGLVSRKLVDDPKWTNVFTLFSQCMDEIKKVAEVRLQLHHQSHFLDLEDELDNPHLKQMLDTLSPDSDFKRIMAPLFTIDEKIIAQFPLVNAARDVDKAINGSKSTFPDPYKTSVAPMYSTEEIYDIYPMLTFCADGEYDSGILVERIFAYIRQVDEAKQ